MSQPPGQPYLPQSGTHWIQPEYMEHNIAALSAEQQRRADRATARLTLGLSLACTALCLYDMFLLATRL